jgi:xanthine/CO dehydrogenase XdhC/CoxF family maturation factor
MSVRQIIRTFDRWQRDGAPLVLATVYETLGSTYSKAGHRILIAENGDYQGLVSGGCLEGDLAERASKVLATGEPATVTYDMRDDADELWGLGVGCNGLIRVFMQPLMSETSYEPFTAIAAGLHATLPSVVALVVASRDPDLPVGATLIWDRGARAAWQLEAKGVARLRAGCERVAGTATSSYEIVDDGVEVLYSQLRPIPRLLVLGAGLDAMPLVTMAVELGWLVTVADHRPAYLEHGDFSAADRCELIRPVALAETFDLDTFDAIVVMSHHLATDREYLRQLAEVPARYLGVLGPGARRERLLDDLGTAAEALRLRLKGPVGIDIGADSPESIALSVLAEIHAALATT